MKLSITQRSLVGLLRDGYDINFHFGDYTLYKGKQSYGNIRTTTARALMNKNIIDAKYTLTPIGKTIEI